MQFLASAVYNLYFHPLARVPGPLLARATSIPSWYHTYTGKRHVWLWQQFQIYGYRVRVSPDTVLFCDPDAYADIYGFKSNVRRSDFYTAWRRNVRDQTTINTVGVAEHAHKRKLLMTAFTDKSVRAATKFIIKHVDRWNELLVTGDSKEWSPAVDFARRAEMLEFDIMGDLSFGTSFGIKEPGNNPLKVIPHNIAEYMQFQYPVSWYISCCCIWRLLIIETADRSIPFPETSPLAQASWPRRALPCYHPVSRERLFPVRPRQRDQPDQAI